MNLECLSVRKGGLPTLSSILRTIIVVLLVGVCCLLLSDSALAQCAMCRSSVTQAVAKNLNIAVIVLLAPPVTIFTAIFYIAFRNRKG